MARNVSTTYTCDICAKEGSDKEDFYFVPLAGDRTAEVCRSCPKKHEQLRIFMELAFRANRKPSMADLYGGASFGEQWPNQMGRGKDGS